MSELSIEHKRKVRKPLLWIGIASIVMTFAGLTSGYFVSRTALLAENRWLQFELPSLFMYATVAIVLSSLTMMWAKASVKKGDSNNLKLAIAITFILGVSFAIFQLLGWKSLIDNGLYFTGPKSNTAVSWVYVISALHWLHVISGLIVLGVTFVQAQKNKYTQEDYLGLEMSSIYWHFLDFLWVYLFCFLLIIR